MLTDDQFNQANDNQLPIKSPGGFMVWIDETHNLFFDDVDADDEKEVNITRYTDENGRKRLIDTQTFKEFFSLEHVTDTDVGDMEDQNKYVNAAKAMGYIK